jgi:tetratricopeptide (TPR) repeat protein
LDAKRAQNDRHGMATTYANLAAVYFQEGDLTLAEEMYLLSLEGFRENGDLKGEGMSLLGLAGIRAERGDLKEALQHFQLPLLEMGRQDSSRRWLWTAW